MSESGSSSLKLRAEPSARSVNDPKSEKGWTGAGPDIENRGGAVFEDPYKYEFMEASFFLALVSILVMNEGVIRMIHFGKTGSGGLLQTPLRLWAAFLGSLLEIINGILGLLVGIGGGVLDWYVLTNSNSEAIDSDSFFRLGRYSHNLAVFFFFSQIFLGVYVFVVFVLVIPIFRIVAEAPQLDLPRGASYTLGALGILSTFIQTFSKITLLTIYRYICSVFFLLFGVARRTINLHRFVLVLFVQRMFHC